MGLVRVATTSLLWPHATASTVASSSGSGTAPSAAQLYVPDALERCCSAAPRPGHATQLGIPALELHLAEADAPGGHHCRSSPTAVALVRATAVRAWRPGCAGVRAVTLRAFAWRHARFHQPGLRPRRAGCVLPRPHPNRSSGGWVRLTAPPDRICERGKETQRERERKKREREVVFVRFCLVSERTTVFPMSAQ